MLAFAEKNSIKKIYASELSRISRRVSNLTVTIEYLVEEYGMTIIIQHPSTMVFKPEENGKLDIIQKSMLMMLGLGAEMELHYQQARRLEGIAIAKNEGRYRGRIKGSKYSKEQLLSRHNDIVNLLEHSSLPDTKIREITGKGLSTVKRVKKSLINNT
jgi:DNA invertase Pin-like site-specific DNA recombinase